MEKQNVTLSLPKALMKKAKVLAAKSDKSLSELMREALQEKLRKNVNYESAMRKHKNILEMELDLGTEGKISFSREELYG